MYFKIWFPLAQKKNKAYDMDGELASNGCLNEALLYDINQLPYFEKSFPKSLAFEDFSKWFKSCSNFEIV